MSASIKTDFAVHPLTLRFSGEKQEAAFLEDYYQKSLNQVRFSLAMAILLYALFGILDYLLIPDVIEQVWIIRYAIVIPFLFLHLLSTWSSAYKRAMQPALAVSALLVGFGIIAMTVIAYPPGSYYYYAGLILVLMWVYTFIAARFVYATFAGWTIVIIYEIVAIWVSKTPLTVMISNSFFFVSASFIGMLACYLIELYKRRDYWQRISLEAERERSQALLSELRSELVLASEIQNSLQPAHFLKWEGGDLVCYSKPTLEIGGDFYIYHFLEKGCFALALGDVSGHGIPAALLMSATLAVFNSSLTLNLSPCERLSQLDLELVPYTEKRHQNCAFCYLELDGQTLSIANAGGIPPFIRRVSGEVERLAVGGFPLGHGLGAEFGYKGTELTLTEGDMIILVTDGTVEAKDRDNHLFGFTRLEQVIAGGPREDAREMLEHIVMEIFGYTDKNQPQDDFTIAVLHFKAG